MLQGNDIDKIRALPEGNIYKNILALIELQLDKKEITNDIALELATKLISDYNNKVYDDIYISNQNDKTEIAIKKNIEINQIFLNGLSEVANTIGFENLRGITNISGGKQRQKFKEYIEQYCEMIGRPDLKRNALQIIDIFDEPFIIDYDGRGKTKSGFYINRGLPSIAEYFSHQNNVIIDTVNNLAFIIGLINSRYIKYNNDFSEVDKEDKRERLLSINKKFTVSMLNSFYCYVRPELSKRVYNILNSLEDDYKVIEYEKVYEIISNDDNTHTSMHNERTIIRKAESKILKDKGFKTMTDVYRKKKQRDYFKSVVDYLNSTYCWNIKKYYQKISITILDYEKLESLIIDNNLKNQYKQEIKQIFANRIANKIDSDFERNQSSFNEAKRQFLIDNNDIKELHDLAVYDDAFIEKQIRKSEKGY